MNKIIEVLVPVLLMAVLSFGTYMTSEIGALKSVIDRNRAYITVLDQLRKEADDYEHRLREIEKECFK